MTTGLDVLEAAMRRRRDPRWPRVQRRKFERILAEASALMRRSTAALLVHENILRHADSSIVEFGDRTIVYYGTDHPRVGEMRRAAEIVDFPSYAMAPFSDAAPPLHNLEREILAHDVRVAVPTSSARSTFLAEGFRPERVVVAPLGIPSWMSRAVEATDPPVSFRLIYAGRVTRGKGLAPLVEFAINEPGVTLTVVGPHDGSIRLPSHRDVTVLPPVDRNQLQDLFRSHSAIALPSYSEGFGYSPLEGMASGLPAVLTTRTFASNVSCPSGFEIVDVGSIQDIARAVDTIRAAGQPMRVAAARFAAGQHWDRTRRHAAAHLMAATG